MRAVPPQLRHAVTILATGKGGIKERLTSAYMEHLIDLDPLALLPHQRETFMGILQRAKRYSRDVTSTSMIPQTIDEMTEDIASELANDIMKLFYEFP